MKIIKINIQTLNQSKWQKKQFDWLWMCIVYLGFNDDIKLYFVKKVERGTVYLALMIYEEIY